jgi:hypothetical protein
MFIFLVLLIFAAMTGFFIYTPGYLESKIMPDLMKKAGINLFSLHVRNVGISGAELSDVRFGDGILAGIEIDSIRIDYSPLGLFHRKIEGVVLSGISIPLEYRDKSFSIKGLNFKNAGDGASAASLSVFSCLMPIFAAPPGRLRKRRGGPTRVREPPPSKPFGPTPSIWDAHWAWRW